MRFPMWLAVLLCASALFAPGSPAADAADEAKGVAARDAALAAAKPVIAAARKAAKGDVDTNKALKAARAAMEPFVEAMRPAHKGERAAGKNPAFATAWNELMTVWAYHDVVGKTEYLVDWSEILWTRYLLGLPTGPAWSWEYNKDKDTIDQLHMLVDQKRPNGQKLRQIKVWTYRWDTVYSGVGGENSKGLAKMMYDVDKDITAKSKRKVSESVTAKRLNAEFDRAYYYYVEGLDVDEEKRLRRDNYYLKGLYCTFNFEIISYLDPTDGDDDVTKWQCSEEDPEIRAVLYAIVSNPNYKPPK